MQTDQLVFPLREHSQETNLLQLPCSSPKKWIRMARGRFSSAAEKREKDENLESLKSWRREGCWVEIQREVQAVPGSAQQWGTWMEEGVQHRLLAKSGRGKNPDLKKRQTGAITTWKNHYPGKAKSKVLYLNPAGKKDGAVCWDGQRRQHRWQTAERERDDWKRTVFLCKQEAERYWKPVDLNHNEDLEIRQQWVKSARHITEAFTKGHLHTFDDLWVARLISPLAHKMDILKLQRE